MSEKYVQQKSVYDKYTNPSLPGAFTGLSGFLKNNKGVKKKLASRVIKGLPVYTLHVPIKYTFKRTRTFVKSIDDQWQADLVDMSNVAGSNSNYKFILTVIDVFSKKAWAIPLLNKTAERVKDAYKEIFKDGRKPKQIYSDDGNEFKGVCKDYLTEKNIEIFVAKTKNKASVIERFNRTLKEMLHRYFTFMKEEVKTTNLHTKRYIDVLPKIMLNYNNKFHRSIKMSPNMVTKANENIVFKNLYSPSDINSIELKFKKGQFVRIVKEKSIFDKGYTAGWSKSIHVIYKIIAQDPVLYILREIRNDKVIETKGYYYTEELQQVELPFETKERVENILKKSNEEEEEEAKNKKDASVKITPKKYQLRSGKK
jgi:hypothetical protein